MNCAWGYSWHNQYFYNSWLFWLFVMLMITMSVVFLLRSPRKKQQLHCPGCKTPVQDVYLRCPECGQRLKSHCQGCSRIVENSWQFCPYCKEPLHHGEVKKQTKAGMESA